MKILTYSKLKTLSQCPWKCFLSYYLGIKPVERDQNLTIGTLIHEFMDRIARNKGNPNPPNIIQEVRDKFIEQNLYCPDDELRERELIWIRVQAMLSAYQWRWQKMDEKIEIVASELEFEIPLINPDTGKGSRTYKLAGKIDQIVKLPNGSLAVREFKTSSEDLSPGSDYWKRLRLDSQQSIYFLAARRYLGYNVEFVFYDVLGKSKIEPKSLNQAETQFLIETGTYQTSINKGEDALVISEKNQIDYPPEYNPESGFPEYVLVNGEKAEVVPGAKSFGIKETVRMFGHRLFRLLVTNHERFFARKEIARGDQDMKEIQKKLWITSKILLEREKGDYWEKVDSACFGFQTCPYFYSFCANGWTPPESIPEGFHTTTPHEELEGGK